MSGKIALVGSGEYLPGMGELESWLLEDRPRTYVQIATAAAPEGERSIARWHELGKVESIAGAGLIYLSGGNPNFLAQTLRETLAWKSILEQWRAGTSIAGCSAGAMALCGYVPNFRHPKEGGESGLGLVFNARVIPHFDRYSRFIPDFALKPLLTDGQQIIGIDENTALTSSGPGENHAREWAFRSVGQGSSWRIDADRKHRINGSIQLLVDTHG
jgi:cyanophycinase